MAPRFLACVRCGFFKEASLAPADKIQPLFHVPVTLRLLCGIQPRCSSDMLFNVCLSSE